MTTHRRPDINSMKYFEKTTRNISLAGAVALVAALASGSALAQTSPSMTNPASAKQTSDFWTAKRHLDAKPIELIPAPTHKLEPLSAVPQSTGPELMAPGAPPAKPGDTSFATRIHPAVGLKSSDDGISPSNTSSHGSYFTTSRVFPDAATSTWPYSISGRLTAFNPVSGQTLFCSASVLRPRIVITAGHCVYHAGPTNDDPSTNRYFYKNLAFTPSYNNGAAPFGQWAYSWVIVSGTWSNGGGTVPNAQDIAMLEIADKGTSKIGSTVGYYGYGTGGLSPNHLTIIGYPCNIDNCAKMQNTNAGSYASGGNNTVVYGSAQRGGTSGGPWVQDFGLAGAGAPSGTAGNWLRGVSSYGPTATEPKYLGASILQASGAGSFGNLLTQACAHKAGNC